MDAIPPHLHLGDEPEEENFLASVYGVFPESTSSVPSASAHTEHACPLQPAGDCVCPPSSVLAASHELPGDPAAQRSSDMRASLGALVFLVALHFHGDSRSTVRPPLLGDSGQSWSSEVWDPQGQKPEALSSGSRSRLAEGRESGCSGSKNVGPTMQRPSPRGDVQGLWPETSVCATDWCARTGPQGMLPPEQLQDKRIGLRAAEQSAETFFERTSHPGGDCSGRLPDQSQAGHGVSRPSEPDEDQGSTRQRMWQRVLRPSTGPLPPVVNLEEEELPSHPGRKARQEEMSAEELEYQSREIPNGQGDLL